MPSSTAGQSNAEAVPQRASVSAPPPAQELEQAGFFTEDDELTEEQRLYKKFVTSLSERSLDYLHHMQKPGF